MAATDKSLARSNKSRAAVQATNKRGGQRSAVLPGAQEPVVGQRCRLFRRCGRLAVPGLSLSKADGRPREAAIVRRILTRHS
jgi:hypothetical protein